MKQTLLVAIGSLTLITAAIFAILWGYDVWSDRKHKVSISGPTPIFAGDGDEACGGSRLTTGQAHTDFQVRRIQYWKNCATIDIKLPDGRKGYVVMGEGEFSILPPLKD